MSPGPRLAITGLGVLTACGRGLEALRGAPALGTLPAEVAQGLPRTYGGRFPAALVDPADPERAWVAGGLALDDALADADPPPGCLLILGTGLGPMELQLARFAEPPAPGQLAGALPADLTARLAASRGLDEGPTFCVTCVSGSYALEAAQDALLAGRAPAVAVLGLETLNRQIQAGFCALDALSASWTPGAPPPADGIVLGEAACCVVLEPLDRARARGARIHGVLLGSGVWVDATHLIAPDPGGAGLAQALELALDRAAVGLADLDALTLTADTSPLYAATYAAALERLGGVAAPRESWEAAGGHALAASASLGLAWACTRPGVTANLTVGFGGQNAVSVVARAADPAPAPIPRPAPGWVACAWATGGAPDLEDRFAPRWNPRRPLPAELRPALEASWDALAAAGWGDTPGTAVEGGLVLAVDRVGLAAAERFAAQVDAGRALRPGEFLASLPSTPAGTLGLVLGLHAYQATLCHPERAPLDALEHAVALLRRGALGRVLLVALSVREPEAERRLDAAPAATLAVALALEADAGDVRVAEVRAADEGEQSAAGALLVDLSPSYRGLPAAGLLALARAPAPGGVRWGARCVELTRPGEEER
ncbi:MAG: beta-ketoacyl synthase N-terminal-like domain-containing protein [Planctomycetota bacterium]